MLLRSTTNKPLRVVAKLSGAAPKSELDKDLMKRKSALETGKAPQDAAQQV
jgi:hypothetical protein